MMSMIPQLDTVVSSPVLPFIIGLVSIIYMLVRKKYPAFMGLIAASFLVGLTSTQIPLNQIVPSITEAFGNLAADIGIPILTAAIIGKCIMDSGSAERIVRAFLSITGRDQSEYALLGTSYLLSIPVVFDNVFYLLAPIGRSMRARTGEKYALYIIVLSAGGLATNMLVPPTAAPLAAAQQLNIDIGLVILVGLTLAIPTSITGGVIYGKWIDQRMDLPLREALGTTEEDLKATTEQSVDELPSLIEAVLPIAIPILLIGVNSVVSQFYSSESTIGTVTGFVGNANFALTIAALIATWSYFRWQAIDRETFNNELTESLYLGGNLLAITAAGATFGQMLAQAGVGEYIVGGLTGLGIPILMSVWIISVIMRVAQGSATVALLTSTSLVAPLAGSLEANMVYLMMAASMGSMFAPWYNDSAFWLVNEIAGITQRETFKTFSAACTVMSVTGLVFVLVMSYALPLA